MFGRSVFLSDFSADTKFDARIDYLFTSLHIAEEFDENYKGRVAEMLRALKQCGIPVIADVSPRTLDALSYATLEDFIKDTGVHTLRFDFGFSNEEIRQAAALCNVAVNASTLQNEDAALFKGLKNAPIFIHNYYPRPETGLDGDVLLQKNAVLHENGYLAAAFIAGSEIKRGPLHKGLPTLEAHRYLPPYLQYLELARLYRTDLILCGDPGLDAHSEKLILDTVKDGIIRIPASLSDSYRHLYGKIYHSREDSPHRLIRFKESRLYATQGTVISPENCVERRRGTITIDNENYLRYSGELQLICEFLPADSAVNVIGKVDPSYLPILNLIQPGDAFMLV